VFARVFDKTGKALGDAFLVNQFTQNLQNLPKVAMDAAGDFVDAMKSEVFEDRVYAFTPRGDLIDLPADSTPIDFAYHIHTDIGHTCVGAKVNRRLVPLNHVLQTGDEVDSIVQIAAVAAMDAMSRK
jgi:(p)ppGpp synthase/HD superfamily hydrolase